MSIAAAAALSLSAWIAVETGQAQEERVEAVVPEAPFKTHEEAAERFLAMSGVLLLVSAAGLLRGASGRAARYVTLAGAFGLLVAGLQVGHTGGQLVYAHGAASAYANPAGSGDAGESGEGSRAGEEREGHERGRTE